MEEHWIKIYKLLEYIDENISNEKKILISNISKELKINSERHLNRIFKHNIGETIKDFITRLRLDKSGKLLSFSNFSINEIARQSGFIELSTFNKAFKKRFGVSPTKFQKQIFENIQKSKSDFKEIEITYLPKLEVLSIQVIGNYKDDTIKKDWDLLLNFAKEHNIINEKTEYFGIIHDDFEISEPDKCRYDACITFDNQITTEGKYTIKTIPKTEYAKFVHSGSILEIEKTYEKIFTEWLSNTKYELSDKPIIEKYLNDFQTDPKELITEIYVPINKLKTNKL
jgi:AraC family transcriptional regulator